jgi:hypothetical protein
MFENDVNNFQTNNQQNQDEDTENLIGMDILDMKYYITFTHTILCHMREWSSPRRFSPRKDARRVVNLQVQDPYKMILPP